MPVFGKYGSDQEMTSLIQSFLPNLKHTVAAIRRVASIAIHSICQNSKEPGYFLSYTLNFLLDQLKRIITGEKTVESIEEYHLTLVGSFLCVKDLMPLFCLIPSNELSCIPVVGVSSQERESTLKEISQLTDHLTFIYELLLFSLQNETDHRIILSALEALLQIVKSPPSFFLYILLSEEGIQKSKLDDIPIRNLNLTSSPSCNMSQRLRSVSSFSSQSGIPVSMLEDEELDIRTDMQNLKEPIMMEDSTHLSKSLSGDLEENPNGSDMDETASEIGHSFHKSSDSLAESDIPALIKQRRKPSLKQLEIMRITYDTEENYSASPELSKSPLSSVFACSSPSPLKVSFPLVHCTFLTLSLQRSETSEVSLIKTSLSNTALE